MNEFLEALEEFIEWCYQGGEFEYGNVEDLGILEESGNGGRI